MAGRLKIYNANTSAWEYTSADFANNVNQIFNEVPTGLVNGSNTAYTTASTYVSGSLNVFKNGIRLKGAGNDYTETTGGFTMVSAPATGTVLLVDYNVATGIYSTGINTFEPLQIPAGLVNSSNTTYTCAKSYIGGTLQVYINGILQAPTTHYTETTPSTGVFTMGDAPLTGDNILVTYQHEFAASGDADTVDGIHASATPTANSLLALGSDSMVPTAALGGAWASWVPTWTNLPVTGSTVNAKYSQIGKTVNFRVSVVLGGGNVPAGLISFTPPVTASANFGAETLFGKVRLSDVGTGDYTGWVQVNDSTHFYVIIGRTDGVFLSGAVTSSTSPFTFTNGDVIIITGTYEAA